LTKKKKPATTSRKTSRKRKTTQGDYGSSRLNATKHGILSQYTVLPWEDEKEYQGLLSAVVEEYSPKGPTEMHLVEELAGIIWRKRRLRIAEAGCFGLEGEAEVEFNNPKLLVNKLSVDYEGLFPDGVELDHNNHETAKKDPHINHSEHTPIERPDFEYDPKVLSKYVNMISRLEKKEHIDVNEFFSPLAQKRWEFFWETFSKGYLSPDDRDEEKFPEFNRQMLLMFLRMELATFLRIYNIKPPDIEKNYRKAIQSARKIEYDSIAKLSRYETTLDRKFEKTLTILIRLQEMRKKREAIDPEK